MSLLSRHARDVLQSFYEVKADAELLTPTIEERQTLLGTIEETHESLTRAIEEKQAFLDTMLENRFAGMEIVAEAWAAYELARGKVEAKDLIRKKHPACTSAEVVRAKSNTIAGKSVVQEDLRRHLQNIASNT